MAELARGNCDEQLAEIDALVARTRRTLRAAWVVTGAGLTIGLCLAAVVLTSLLDLLVPLPTLLRFAACLLIVVPTGLAFIAGIAQPAARRLSEIFIARRIEKLLPHIQSRLITSLDLAHDGTQRRQSAAFFQRLVSETAERVVGFRPASIVNRKNLRRAGIFAAVATIVCFTAFVVFHDRLPTALARILAPFADIPPATGVRFTADPGDSKTLKGDDFTIAAVLEKGEPSEMELEYRPVDGKWLRQPMIRSAPDRFEVTLNQLDNSIEYRLVGGGTWTTRHSVDVIERPSIAALHTVVNYPAYMKLTEPKVGPPQTADAAGPVGSDIEIVVEVAGDAVAGEIQVLVPVTKMQVVKDRRERVWFEGKIPDGARPEGNWQWDFGLKFRAAHTEPPAAGPHGHGFQGAPAPFEIQPGDYIFTYVYIVPDQVTEEIMLQFHDGTNVQQRAFWGADKIQAGELNTPSRARIGDLPAAGEWVRLEIPAKTVGLEGKKLHGISFMLFGGQAKWNRLGTINPPEVPERVFLVDYKYEMSRLEKSAADADTAASLPTNSSKTHPTNTSTWSGHVPLVRDSIYRVEIKNELGYANKEMKEGKLTAIPDMPPQVVLERPGADLVLSEPRKVPLVVHAYDDFGLADVSLAVQKGDSGGFTGAPIKIYDDPVRSESILAALDLAPHQLKAGELVRYRVQARDRKGQIAQTQEFVVRIAQDNNAADKQLAAITQQQDAFQKKLEQLIGQQSKITESVAKMAGRERPAESSNKADGETQKPNDARPAPTANAKSETSKDSPNTPMNKADAATAAELERKMAELRQELAKLAAPQEQNVALGAQVQSELNQTAAQAEKSRLMPEALAAQMRAAEQMFQNQALQPMRDLLQSMKQAADPQKPNPKVGELADSAERLQQQLEAMKSRLEALARAQQNMKDDPAEALAQLRQELMAQNAEMTAQELAELRDFLDRLMGQMKMLEGRENELARQTKDAMPVVLPEIEKEQTKVEAEADRMLAQAERLAEADMKNELKRRRTPQFPDAPHTPDGEEMIVPPNEDDTAEPPSAEMKGAAEKDAKKADSKKDDADDEDLFMPPTGVRQKMDPRFSKKVRPAPKKAAANDQNDSQLPQSKQDMSQAKSAQQPSQADELRQQLTRREQQTAQRLSEAQRQLQMPREQLAQLMQQLREALGLESDESAQELARLMQSMDLQQAMQLAQAMRQSQAQQPSNQQPQQPQTAQTPPRSTSTQLNTAMRFGTLSEFEGNEIDLTAQTVILRMQPRLREELLKGMREEGPEAYRKFIQDYFNRLTKVKPAP